MPLEPTNEEAVTPPTPLSPEEESFQSGERAALADLSQRGLLDTYIESNNYAQQGEQELQDKWTTAEGGSLKREDLYGEEGFQSANLDDRMGMLDRLSEHNESQYTDDRSLWDKHLYKTVFPDSVHPSDAWEGRSKGQLTIDKAVVASGHNRDFGHPYFKDEHGASYDAWIAFEVSEKGEGDVAALDEQLDIARGNLESKAEKMTEWMKYADFAARQLEDGRLIDLDSEDTTAVDVVTSNVGDFVDGVVSQFPGGMSDGEIRRNANQTAADTKAKMVSRILADSEGRGTGMSEADAEHMADTLIKDAELMRGRFNGDFAMTSTGQLAASDDMYLLNDEDMMAKAESFATSDKGARVGDAADLWMASAREQGDIMAKAIYEQALVSDPEEAEEMRNLIKRGKFDMEDGDHRRAVAAWVKVNGGFSKAGLKFSSSVQSMWGSMAMGAGDITGSEGVRDYAKRELQASQDKNSLASHMSGSEFWTDVAGAVPSLVTSIVPGAIVGKLGAMFRLSKAGKGLGLAAKGTGRSARATVVGSAAFESGIKTYGDARLVGKSPGEASELAGYAALGTGLATRLGIKYGPEALVTSATLKGLTAKKLLSIGIFKEFLKLRGGQFYAATGALLKHGSSEWLEEAGDQMISGINVESRLNPGVTWGELIKQSVHAGNIGFALGAGVPTLRGEPVKDFISYGKSFQNMRRKALIEAALADGEVKIGVDNAIQALTDSHSPLTAAALEAGGKQAELATEQRAKAADKVRSDMEQEEDPKRSIMTRIGEVLAGRNKEDSSPALVKQRARVAASYESFQRAYEAYEKNPSPDSKAILQAADTNVTIQTELATELVDKVNGTTPASKAKVGDTQTSSKPGSAPASTPSGEVPSATPSSPKGKPNRQASTKPGKKDKFTKPTELAPEKEARWQKIAADIGFNSSEATRKDFGDAMNAVRKRARSAKSDAEFSDALADLDVLIEKQEARAVFHNAGHKHSNPGLGRIIQDEANKLKKAREIIVNRRKKTHKKPLPTAPKKKTQPAPTPKASPTPTAPSETSQQKSDPPTPKATPKPSETSTEVPVGENIISTGSPFAQQLTNPKNNVGFTYKGKKYVNSEHAYQTWKSGEFNQAGYDSQGGKVRGGKLGDTQSIMTDIITEKLRQNPHLVEGIDERGGSSYLESSTHEGFGDAFWEGKNGGFMTSLRAAYAAAKTTPTPTENLSSRLEEAKRIIFGNTTVTADDLAALVRMIAPGVPLTGVRENSDVESFSMVPFFDKKTGKSSEFILEINPDFALNIKKSFNLGDNPTSDEQAVVAAHLLLILDEEIRHQGVLQDFSPDELIEFAYEIVSGLKSLGTVTEYFGKDGVKQKEGESDDVYAQRIVAEFTNIVGQRISTGSSTVDIANTLKGMSQKARDFVKLYLGKLRDALKALDNTSYTPSIDQKIARIEKFLHDTYDYKPLKGKKNGVKKKYTALENDAAFSAYYKAATKKAEVDLGVPVAGTPLQTKSTSSSDPITEAMLTLNAANEFLRASGRKHLDESEGMFEVDPDTFELSLRVPDVFINDKLENRDQAGAELPALAEIKMAITTLNESRQLRDAVLTIQQWEDEAPEGSAPRLEVFNHIRGLRRELADPAVTPIREDAIRDELSHAESLVSPKVLKARNTLIRFLRLSVSRPSRDHLNKFGQLLGVEGEAQRQWIKQQATQAIQPLVNEWRRLGLSPNIGRSSRNHAPTHAILELFDNDLPLKMVGLLLENNTTFLEVPVNERVAADMQGLRNHLMRKYEADDRAENETRELKWAESLKSLLFGSTTTPKDTRFLDFRVRKDADQSVLEDFFKDKGVRADDLALVEKINAVLLANEKKLDAKQVNHFYNTRVAGRSDFGSSLILLQGKLGRNGSLTIDLVPPHLSEDDAALFNKTRSADVRYTLGARWASKALLAAGRGEITQDTINRIEQGDPLALRAETGEAVGPVVDGIATSQVLPAVNLRFNETDALLQQLTISIDPDQAAGSNTTFPDAIPFPRRVAKRKVGATRPTDLQKTWIESLVELLEANLAHVDSLTKADGVTPLGRDIHPVSQHGADIIQLANNFLSSYAATQRVVSTASDKEAKWAFERVGLIASYNNLVSRVLNVSNMVAEMKKQSLNQKYFFGEELVDFAMLDLMESAMSDGSLTNISPLALEQAIGSGVAVDTQFVQESLSSEGGRLEQTTNRDDAQKAETILEGFREYGFGHNTSEKQAAQTRAFMLASLFDLNIDAAKQWASQWRTESRLDRELFSLLDDAVDYAQDHEISESRLALATILSGSDSVIKVPDINNARNEDAARSGLNTLFEHIMNLPDGKVVYSPFDSYFNRDANDGGVSTPTDILSTAISQIYADVPVIIYDGANLDKEALNYHTSLALLDSDANVTAVLIDGSQSQFQTGWDSTVSQLVQHAFWKNGISTSTEMAVNAIKSDLDNYAAGLHLEATARAEAEAVVETLQNSLHTRDKGGVDLLTPESVSVTVGEHYQRQLELLAPEVAKVLGWGSRVTPGSFSDIDNVSFITQILTDQRMQLLVDRMNAHNVVVSSATMETTPEAQELARRFMEGAYRPFTEGVDADASMRLTLDGNVGNGFDSIQTTETGEDTDLDTVEDVNETTLPSGVTQGYLEQFGVTNYSKSVAESIISVAFDSLLETGSLIPSAAVTSAIETYSGLTQTGGSKGDADGGRTQSVLDFYDHHALSTIKKDRAIKGRGAVWNNLVDESGEKVTQTVKTVDEKFEALMPNSPVRPAAGPASELEGAAYISHARAAAELGGVFDSIMDRIRVASSLVSDHTEEHEALLREYPDMANAPQEVRTREARLVNRIAVETSIQHAAIEQLDGRGRDQFSDDIGRAAFVQKYENRMWEAKKLRKRNLKNNQVSALPLGDEFTREAGAFLKEQQKDGTYAFLARRVSRVDPSTYIDPEAGSLNPDVVEGTPLQTASVTPSATVDPAVLGTPISAYSAPGASPDVVQDAKDYQLVVRGRLYESDPIYAAAMDANPDGLGGQALHGLIATATEIALSPSFSEEAQSSAHFLLNELADGRVDFFTEEAGKLQGWVVSRWHIDEMVNGVDPKFKENFLLHQDAAVAALVPFDSIANRHAYMVFGEIDLGLRGNAGRAGWQREQKALVDELTLLANRAKPRAATQAYAAALVASTSPDSSLTEREQIERTIATMRAGAERNRGGGRKMSKIRRELRDQAGHADVMLNKAEAWLAKNEGMTEGVAEALDAHMLTGLEPSALKMITKSRAFFKAMHPQLELMYRMQGKTIGNFDRYLPMRGFDLADEAGPETGLDGVELVHMSNAHTRTRFDQDQTRGLDFNPLRSILSGSNTTLYQLNTFAELDQASHVYGNEDTRESQMINVMEASDDLSTEQEGAVLVLNNALKERVRMQTTNDVSFNSHNGLFFKVLGKLASVGYRVSLTSAAQVYLQTLPVAISYVMQNPVKGARLIENLTKMLATAPHSGTNRFLGDKSEGMYLEHVAKFVKYAAPELYARSLDGVNELQDNLSKMNLNEVDSVLDAVKAAPGAALKSLDKLHDLMLQMSTAAPDSLLVRALMATEYEMATGTRVDADTVTNLKPEAAVMARVESEGRMAQSDTSKKSEGFQPVKRKGLRGFSLEAARRGFFVFGNHTMSLAAKQPAAWKMFLHPRSDAGMRKEGLKRITDFMMQVAFFNAMKIRNAAFIASYAFTAGDYDGDDELRRGMSPEELAKYNSKLMDDRDAAMEDFQKEWFKQYGEATLADANKPLDRHDFFYSFAVKGGMELLGTVHPIASIPQLNGAATGLLKSTISEHSEHQAPGYGADFYQDTLHSSLEWAGAPGYALNSVLKTEAAYRTATRDYEFDINDALLLGLTLGGPRENRSDALRSVQDENKSRVINKRHGVHSEVPKFYEALPHGMRGHEPMERPEGYEDIDFSSLSEYAIDPNSISGDWERVSVSLAHRPWNDGDSLQTVRRLLDKRTFRLIDVDTLESSRNTPAMEGRTLEQAVSLGLTHDQVTGAGKRASYATQQLLTHADKIEILTLREQVVSSKRQYGHVIAHIDGKRIDVGAFLVANGHARVRPNAKKSTGGGFATNRLKHLKKWQGDAVRDGRGLHKHRR